jgi:hypothetical protein
MPFYYNDALATAGNLTTNGTANTETETFFLKPGSSRSLYLFLVNLNGKNASQSTLSSIELRPIKWGTASTSGTGLAIVPRDTSSQSATISGSSRSTSGTTRTQAGPIIGCGVTGSNMWQARDWDDAISLPAGSAASISAMDTGSVASLLFSFSLSHAEF